jgi:hypothetical protein
MGRPSGRCGSPHGYRDLLANESVRTDSALDVLGEGTNASGMDRAILHLLHMHVQLSGPPHAALRLNV